MRFLVPLIYLVMLIPGTIALAKDKSSRHVWPGDELRQDKGYVLLNVRVQSADHKGYSILLANFDVENNMPLKGGVSDQGVQLASGVYADIIPQMTEFRGESGTPATGGYHLVELDPGFYSFTLVALNFPNKVTVAHCLRTETFVFEANAGSLNYVGDLVLKSAPDVDSSEDILIVGKYKAELLDPEMKLETASSYIERYYSQFSKLNEKPARRATKEPSKNWRGVTLCK